MSNHVRICCRIYCHTFAADTVKILKNTTKYKKCFPFFGKGANLPKRQISHCQWVIVSKWWFHLKNRYVAENHCLKVFLVYIVEIIHHEGWIDRLQNCNEGGRGGHISTDIRFNCNRTGVRLHFAFISFTCLTSRIQIQNQIFNRNLFWQDKYI